MTTILEGVPEHSSLHGVDQAPLPASFSGATRKIQDDYDPEALQQRRDRQRRRQRRTKQWSDGVIGLVHPGPHELAHELQELTATQKPLLNRESLTFAVPTPGDVTAHVEQEHGQDSWRYRCVEFLHSKKASYFLVALLVLDVLVLFVEITLMALYPNCAIITRDALSCVPSSASTPEERYDPHNLCPPGFIPVHGFPAGCDTHKWHAVHAIEQALFVATMIILSVFLVEIVALLVSLGPSVFFRQAFYVLDLFIVTVSIVLEAVLHAYHNHLSQALVGLIVVLRSWRYVRISHGIVDVTVKLAHEPGFARLLNHTEQLERILVEHGLDVPEAGKKIEKLRSEQEPELLKRVRQHHAAEKRAAKRQQACCGASSSSKSSASDGSGGGSNDSKRKKQTVDGTSPRIAKAQAAEK